jgi:hypothetical protein
MCILLLDSSNNQLALNGSNTFFRYPLEII